MFDDEQATGAALTFLRDTRVGFTVSLAPPDDEEGRTRTTKRPLKTRREKMECECRTRPRMYSFLSLVRSTSTVLGKGDKGANSDGSPVWDRFWVYLLSYTGAASAAAELLAWPFGPM